MPLQLTSWTATRSGLNVLLHFLHGTNWPKCDFHLASVVAGQSITTFDDDDDDDDVGESKSCN